MADAIRLIGDTEITRYRWRQEFGGPQVDQVKHTIATIVLPRGRVIADIKGSK